MNADRQRRIAELESTRERLGADIDKAARELEEKRLTLELIDAQLYHLRNPPPKFIDIPPGVR